MMGKMAPIGSGQFKLVYDDTIKQQSAFDESGNASQYRQKKLLFDAE
jgi:hypothetical protein